MHGGGKYGMIISSVVSAYDGLVELFLIVWHNLFYERIDMVRCIHSRWSDRILAVFAWTVVVEQ